MRVGYLDCFSGISGDMFLGALVDAGVELKVLKTWAAKLPIDGYQIQAERVQRGPLAATQVKVKVNVPQPARGIGEILDILNRAALPAAVLSRCQAVFERLASAEARVHGVPVEKAHLHEVGAVDAMVDVVGTVAGLEELGLKRLWASPLPLSRGWINSAHGPLPVPAPAVTELLRGLPVYGVNSENELVTPTGAALVSTLASGFGPAPDMLLHSVGWGAGLRDLEHPNLLRLLVGEAPDLGERPGHSMGGRGTSGLIAVVETSIDDMNPEFYPFAAERLREAGAIEVYWTPVQMKKGRPGQLLTVLVPPDRLEQASQVLFSETTTLGMRWRLENRLMALREWLEVEVEGHKIRVKYSPLATLQDLDACQAAPEFEDCRVVSKAAGLSLKETYSRALMEFRRRLEQSLDRQ